MAPRQPKPREHWMQMVTNRGDSIEMVFEIYAERATFRRAKFVGADEWLHPMAIRMLFTEHQLSVAESIATQHYRYNGLVKP